MDVADDGGLVRGDAEYEIETLEQVTRQVEDITSARSATRRHGRSRA